MVNPPKEDVIKALHLLLGKMHLWLAGEDVELTYGELNLAEQLTEWYHTSGMKEFDRVAEPPRQPEQLMNVVRDLIVSYNYDAPEGATHLDFALTMFQAGRDYERSVKLAEAMQDENP